VEVGVNNNKKIIYIIYPKTVKKIPSNLLAMSELIINGIVDSKNSIITIRINKQTKLVECNDGNLKRILSILLNANKLEDVKNILWSLLHKDIKNNKNSGMLRCYIASSPAEMFSISSGNLRNRLGLTIDTFIKIESIFWFN
jgi:hypothetical protein